MLNVPETDNFGLAAQLQAMSGRRISLSGDQTRFSIKYHDQPQNKSELVVDMGKVHDHPLAK